MIKLFKNNSIIIFILVLLFIILFIIILNLINRKNIFNTHKINTDKINTDKINTDTFNSDTFNFVNNIVGIDNVFYKITKLYVDDTNIGEVMIDNGSKLTIVNYIIPEFIIYNNYKYKIVEINDYAFFKNKNLKGSLTIPGSIHTIGHYAFAKCFNLNGTLTLNTGITTINSYAFCGLINLQGTLEIPNTVEIIEEHAFEFCINIDTLILKPANSTVTNLKYIGYQAFCMCIKLRGVLIIPGSVETIELYAFYQTFFDNIILEEGIKNVPEDLTKLIVRTPNNKNKMYNSSATQMLPSTAQKKSTNDSEQNKLNYRKKNIKFNLKESTINHSKGCSPIGNRSYYGHSCQKEIDCGGEIENTADNAGYFENAFYNDILFNVNSEINILNILHCGSKKTDFRCTSSTGGFLCKNNAQCLSSFDGGVCDCVSTGRFCYYGPFCESKVRCNTDVIACNNYPYDIPTFPSTALSILDPKVVSTVCSYRDYTTQT